MRPLWLSAVCTAVLVSVVSGASAMIGASRGSSLSGDDLITSVAGTHSRHPGDSGDGGPATSASLNYPRGIAVDDEGSLFIADTNNNRVRKVDACSGAITTFAGTGSPGFSGDGGPAKKAQLHAPVAVAVDHDGNVYIADGANSRIRKVSPDGTITTIAGGGTNSSGEGIPATSAALTPFQLAVDRQGNVFIISGYDVRRVSPDGTIRTVAGTNHHSLPPGPSDTLPLTSQYVATTSIATDQDGNLYITDVGNTLSSPYPRVLKLRPDGTWVKIAGGGVEGGDEVPAQKLALHLPDRRRRRRKRRRLCDRYRRHRGSGLEDQRRESVQDRVWGRQGERQRWRRGPGKGRDRSRRHTPAAGLLAADRLGSLFVLDGNLVRKIWNSPARGAPKLTLAGAPSQTLSPRGVTVSASCDKPCSLIATALVVVNGQRMAPSATIRGTAAGGACPTTLTVRLPPSAQAALRKLLKPGVHGTVTVTVGASAEGRKSVSTRRVDIHG